MNWTLGGGIHRNGEIYILRTINVQLTSRVDDDYAIVNQMFDIIEYIHEAHTHIVKKISSTLVCAIRVGTCS